LSRRPDAAHNCGHREAALSALKVLFGDCVRAHRVALGWSQPHLADEAGISEVWLRRIERGTASPSFETIEAVAKALGVQPVELFGGRPTVAATEATAFAAVLSKLTGRSEGALKRIAGMIDLLDAD
jgi:transcriptional regulator with XRE-family HTH domain